MSNLIKLVVALVVAIVCVIFRKRIHARSKKMYGATKTFILTQKAKHDERKAKKKEQKAVSYI